MTIGAAFQRAAAAWRRAAGAHRRRNRSRTALGRATTALGCVTVGLLVTVSAANARGFDLRPARNTDLVSVVQAQSKRNAELTAQLTAIRAEVQALSANSVNNADLDATDARLRSLTGLTPVAGPAISVTLDDAPASVSDEGIDADLLVVHQQDIQAVVNALWSGGAEAMTIQGQRVIATPGIKCVGNTVVLHGVPYAPPYVVSAIGDPTKLRAALTSSPALQIYRQYVDAYSLLYRERSVPRAEFPGYSGSLELQHAEPPSDTPSDSPTPR